MFCLAFERAYFCLISLRRSSFLETIGLEQARAAYAKEDCMLLNFGSFLAHIYSKIFMAKWLGG